MSENRPYIFELAALLLDTHGPDMQAGILAAAGNNGVDLDQLKRAAEILRGVSRAGQDLAEWVRLQYFIDGWLHGYLPLEASPTNPALTTWHLAQYSCAYHDPAARISSEPI